MDNNNIPKHWQLKKLGDVFVIERGGSPRPIEDYITNDNSGLNWIKIGDTKGVTKYITKTQEKIRVEGQKKSRMVYEGDFILSNSMSFGRPYIMKTSGCIHDGWLVIRKNENVDNNYLYFVLNSNQVYHQFSSLAKGSTVKNLNIAAVQQVQIPLPPLPEQQRIVAKIEELFSELDKGVESLKTAQQQLKVYRQAVLKYAFEGKFTEEWRKQQAAKKQPKMAMAAEPVVEYKPTQQNGDELGELPEGWKWVYLKDISESISDGDHQPPPKSTEGVPFITISNIDKRSQKIDFSDTFKVSFDYFNALKENRRPEKGDILYTVTGSFGIPVIIDFDKDFCFQRHIGLIRPKKSVNQKYLFYSLQTSYSYKQAIDAATGTAQKTVALQSLREFFIPMPISVDEQQQIVSEIERRLSVCDKIEESIVQGLKQAEALRQSILKRAFEGRLV